MKYLFFDIECADGGKATICSFGYVIADMDFNILDHDDIIMNPEGRFYLTGRAGRPDVNLAYPMEYFKKAPNFKAFHSRIKELVENSIDAGATEITIIIKDAGRTLVQVIDNGKGMSMTDARLSFERHATSKIKASTDLFALNTMGFRGEALASIAAIANVELCSKTENDNIGHKIVLNNV